MMSATLPVIPAKVRAVRLVIWRLVIRPGRQKQSRPRPGRGAVKSDAGGGGNPVEGDVASLPVGAADRRPRVETVVRETRSGRMRRIHVIGRKNSGKTTLVVDLVRQLTSEGFRVGTIKHTHHRHELDVPGKDSFRHREAGAGVVGILSPGMHAVFWPQTEDSSDRYAKFAVLMRDCDLVLVEGDSTTTAPKIEVWRQEVSEAPLARTDTTIRAVVTDSPVDVQAPVWPRHDVPGLAVRLRGLLD